MLNGKKKRILVFIDWYLPGFRSGGPVRSVSAMVARLSDEFDFFIVTRDTDYCERIPYKNVVSDQWNTMADGSKVYYFSDARLNKENMKELISSTAFDLVYVNGIYSRFFSILPVMILRKTGKVIVSARGMLSEGSLSVKPVKKKIFLAIAKLLAIHRNIRFHATSAEEAMQIERAFGRNASVVVAPNLSDTVVTNIPVRKEKNVLRLVYIARVAPEKNLAFALESLRNVQSQVQFSVFGPVYDEQYLQHCMSIVRTLPGNVNVEFRGAIDPVEVTEQLHLHHFLYLPSSGENFGHVIMQSLAASRPVLISDRTPWLGLQKKKAGFDLSLDDPALFSRTIEACAALEQAEYDALSAGAAAMAGAYLTEAANIRLNRELFNS